MNENNFLEQYHSELCFQDKIYQFYFHDVATQIPILRLCYGVL